MTEAFAIHPNVVAYICAKRMVSYKDYINIAETFFNTNKRVLWNDKVYDLVAYSRTKCKIFPVEKECRRVLKSDFLKLCEHIAAASDAPSIADGIFNWAISELDYCILAIPADTV